MSLSKTSIQTKNLSIGYRDKSKRNEVQKNIDLNFNQGEFIAILGKNGSGKSTLLRTLTKIQEPLYGEVLIKDQSLESYSNKELSTSISVVLTERLPESHLTVLELVSLGRHPYTNWIGKLQDSDLQKVHWALQQTDTIHLSEKPFYELSDGQFQRVMIARALAQDTDIIFLDEPTAHLDMHHTIKIFQLLKELVNQINKTIVITSHEINLAIQQADQLVLLTENQVVCGTKKELIEKKAFDHLFISEMITFSESLEQFVIKKSQ